MITKTSLTGKLIIGFITLFFFTVALAYWSMYLPNIRILRNQAENSIETVSIQVVDQVEQVLMQMETVSNIIQGNSIYRELLILDNIDYLAQLRNYWVLIQNLRFVNSLFYTFDFSIYLRYESLLVYEKDYFYSIKDIEDAVWLDEVIKKNGGIVWVLENGEIPVISAVRLMDRNILMISVAQSEFMNILDAVANNINSNIYIMDQNKVLLHAGDDLLYNDTQLKFTRTIQTNDWQIVTVAPIDYFESEVRNAQLFFFISMLLLFIFFLLVILTLVRGAIATEKRKKQLELQALQARIKPHFIYNSLDAINWLALDSNNEQVSNALINLATLLRKNFTLGDDIVTIKDEIEHVTLYVEAMKYRADCVINLCCDIDESMQNSKAIKFTFQPLIENAILHGFIKAGRTTGTIKITGWLENGYNIVTIQDDGAGFDSTKQEQDTGSFGLNSVKERLKLYSDESSIMTVESVEGQGTTVLLKWK